MPTSHRLEVGVLKIRTVSRSSKAKRGKSNFICVKHPEMHSTEYFYEYFYYPFERDSTDVQAESNWNAWLIN